MTIICADGGTHISGDILTIIEDFTNVVASVRECLCDRLPEEKADEIIALCGQLAYNVNDGGKTQEHELLRRVANVLRDD